jgi:hypothetical protein
MGRLMDVNEIAPIIASSLGEPERLSAVEPVQIRYRPGMHFVVRYRALLPERAVPVTVWLAANRDLARRASDPRRVALARRAAERSEALQPLRFDHQAGVLVQWFPVDIDLPTLVDPPDRLALDVIGEDVYADGTTELLVYKPRRRATLRTGNAVLKLYAKTEHFLAARTGLAFSAHLGEIAPTALGSDARRNVTAQRWVDGIHITDPAAGMRAAKTVLDAMRTLESSAAQLPEFPPALQLAEAARAGSIAEVLVPELSTRIGRLLSRLEDDVPQGLMPRPAHGDLTPAQIIEKTEGGIAVVDFDTCCLAPAALDPAIFAAGFIGRDGDGLVADDVLGRLVDDDEEARAGLRWYFATSILRRAPRPFRHVFPDWPDRVSAIVSAAEQAFRP